MASEAGNLKVETIHLKVHIHCEGCRKKVKKILTRIEGVYTVDINASLGKVTVTGTVDPKTLTKKLEKAGKVVELWPSGGQAGGGDGGGKPNQQKEKAKVKEKEKEKGLDQHQPKPQENQPKSQENKGSTDKKGHDAEATKGEQAKVKEEHVNTPSKGQNGEGSTKSPEENGSKKKGNSGGGGNNTNKNGGGGNNANKSSSGGNNANTSTSNGSSGKKDNKEGLAKEAVNQATTKPTTNGIPSNAHHGDNGSNQRNDENEKVPSATLNGDEVFSEASSSSKNTVNKNVTPPPMVLVETEYDHYVEPRVEEDYATHLFSDENANNCSLM